MYNSNKRPRGDDWSSAQSGHAGYPGGGSWGGDQMYGGAINPSARDYGPANAAMGGGMAGMMSANGGGGAAGMMAGAGGMPGGMGPGGMSSGMVGGGGGAGMMGHGGGMGMMPGSSMGGAGMMQQGGMGAASPMMGPAAGGGGGGGGAMGSMTGSMGGGMAAGQMGGMGGGMMGGMSSSGGGMGSMSGGHMGGHMGSHMGGGSGMGVMMPQQGAIGGGSGGGMAGYEGGMGAFPAVRLRGLPFGVREDEVRAFLGCDTVDVLLTRKGGRPSGEAFVVLGTPYQVEGALQRNKSYLGRRYVEVFSAHKHEYYSAVAQYMAEGGDGGPQQHYGGGGRGMYDGRPDHRRDQEEDPRRDDGRHRAGNAPPQQPQQLQQGGDQAAQHTGMLKLRGLPFSCTKADIMEWFTDLPVAPIASDGVRIVINADGRPSGMAFVEFASPADAATAMAKDRKMLGNRYVELFPSSREEATMDRGGRR